MARGSDIAGEVQSKVGSGGVSDGVCLCGRLLEGVQRARMAIIKMFVDEREDLVFEIRGVDIEAFPSDGASQRGDFRGVRIG